MRKTYFDRSPGDRRHGMRRSAVAAWAVVLILFSLLFVVPLAGGRPAASGEVIPSLVARAVPPVRDACDCVDFDHLELPAGPPLC